MEKSNRTLKTMIDTFVGSPAFLNYGRQSKPVNSQRRELEKKNSVIEIDPIVWEDRMKGLNVLRDLVAKFVDREREKQTKYYNRNKREAIFNADDLVLWRSRKLSKTSQRFAAKLAPKYEEPFRIIQPMSPKTYEMEVNDKRRVANAHVSDLERYIPPKIKTHV